MTLLAGLVLGPVGGWLVLASCLLLAVYLLRSLMVVGKRKGVMVSNFRAVRTANTQAVVVEPAELQQPKQQQHQQSQSQSDVDSEDSDENSDKLLSRFRQQSIIRSRIHAELMESISQEQSANMAEIRKRKERTAQQQNQANEHTIDNSVGQANNAKPKQEGQSAVQQKGSNTSMQSNRLDKKRTTIERTIQSMENPYPSKDCIQSSASHNNPKSEAVFSIDMIGTQRVAAEGSANSLMGSSGYFMGSTGDFLGSSNNVGSANEVMTNTAVVAKPLLDTIVENELEERRNSQSQANSKKSAAEPEPKRESKRDQPKIVLPVHVQTQEIAAVGTTIRASLTPVLDSTSNNPGIHSRVEQPMRRQQGGSIKTSRMLHLTSEEYLEEIMKFAEKQVKRAEIDLRTNNLGGARSSLSELWTFTKSFISSIDRLNDGQLTTFGLKVFETIAHVLIAGTNLKGGIERMPLKEQNKQAEKNSINCYILIVNAYRMMGLEKVWLIVFGKTLKLLEFIYKRKQDITTHTELELIRNNYMELSGELAPKYLSRVDYLSYFLIGLTTFDPLEIIRQDCETNPKSAVFERELGEYGRKWSFTEFWVLVDCLAKNRHVSYFKPILYMNIVTLLYPQLRVNKADPTRMKDFANVFKYLLAECQIYFKGFGGRKQDGLCRELNALMKENYDEEYEFDGQDFKDVLGTLHMRLKEKQEEAKLPLREFQQKACIFGYFLKSRD